MLQRNPTSSGSSSSSSSSTQVVVEVSASSSYSAPASTIQPFSTPNVEIARPSRAQLTAIVEENNDAWAGISASFTQIRAAQETLRAVGRIDPVSTNSARGVVASSIYSLASAAGVVEENIEEAPLRSIFHRSEPGATSLRDPRLRVGLTETELTEISQRAQLSSVPLTELAAVDQRDLARAAEVKADRERIQAEMIAAALYKRRRRALITGLLSVGSTVGVGFGRMFLGPFFRERSSLWRYRNSNPGLPVNFRDPWPGHSLLPQQPPYPAATSHSNSFSVASATASCSTGFSHRLGTNSLSSRC